MALIKCEECGNEISTKAEACPKCGAPVKAQIHSEFTRPLKPLEAIGSIIIAGLVIWWLASPSATESKPVAQDCKSDDLQCLGDKGIVGASVYCQDAIEKFAAHSVKWTDGTFEMKFSRFRWHDKAKGEITYVGDKAEFQNGFGAFTPVIYECDMGPDTKTVLDARVLGEGRLP